MPKPVYALIGADSYLQLEKLAAILTEFPQEVQRVDVDGERTELAEVFDELRSFAMFGGAKLVVMRNADAFVTRFREQLETYLAAPSTSGTLVLRLNSLPANQRIYKLISKVGAIEKCEPPKQSDLPRWIISHAKFVHQVVVTPDAANLLAELIGVDMGRLDNELAKLAVQSDSNRVDVRDVERGVSFQRDQEMWDMTNQIAAGHIDQAIRRWRQLTASDSSAEFRAVTWLGMWLEKAYQAVQLRRKGMNPSAVGSQLKIWPRDLQEPFVKTAEKLGESGIARALDLLVDTDHHSKTGLGDAAENVERFLLSVGQLMGR